MFVASPLGWGTRGLFVVCACFVGCATDPSKVPEPAPAGVTLQEYSKQAAAAAAEGSRTKSRDIYRTAARAYPASQLPWLKLAEDYFESADYGNAILAAQEVLLRDSSDSVAASVLAVSGLRVSASALQTLRAQNRIAGGTRSEAQTMARTLREVLGESVLVPQPTAISSTNPAPSTTTIGSPVASPGAAAIKPRVRPRPIGAAAKSDAPAPSTTSSNPFSILK